VKAILAKLRVDAGAAGAFLKAEWRTVLPHVALALALIFLVNRGVAAIVSDPWAQILLSMPVGFAVCWNVFPAILLPILQREFFTLARNAAMQEHMNDHVIRMLISMLKANNIEHPIIDEIDAEKGGKSVH
jgi:hypothetical protein